MFFIGIKSRETTNKEINVAFATQLRQENILLTLHWDGKLVKNSNNTGDEPKIVDRLTVAVSSKKGNKLIGIPKLTSGLYCVIFKSSRNCFN